MNKKTTIIILVVLLLVVFSIYQLTVLKGQGYFAGQNSTGADASEKQEFNLDEDKAFLFVGEGCGHCADVEEQIEAKNLRDKVAIQEIEVFQNSDNQEYYLDAFKRCNQDTNGQIGVPVLYYQGECISGPTAILEKLEALAK